MTPDILTPLGLALESSLLCLREALESAAKLQQPVWEFADKIAKSPNVPVWDAGLHELRLGRRIIKRFRCPAPAQELILAVYEEEGWPPKIDDPLPMTSGIDPKRRLHQTIRNLNRAQRPHGIHFSVNGNGQSIRWELKHPPTRKRP